MRNVFQNILKQKFTFFEYLIMSVCGSLVCNTLFATCDCPSPNPTTCPAQPDAPCTSIQSANQYVLRYFVNGDRGAMTFIGNTLGLAKARCLNERGTSATVVDSIGAFTTINPLNVVADYQSLASGPGSPAGTTLDWTQNSSSAVLNLPPGIIILHAELVWSGSFGFFCSDPDSGSGVGVDPNCVLDYASGPILFTTPDGITHEILADPTTALESQNPAPDVQPHYCGGNYTRTQDVTALMISLGDSNGTYTVGRVPATISAFDNFHNAAGWTLAIVYHNELNPVVNNMALFLGAQQGSRALEVIPASVSGFCAQTNPGLQSARILVSAIEGDANNGGDQMLFGPTLAPGSLQPLFSSNNPALNFFASQINDDNGALIDTTGTYCTFNHNPTSGELVPNGRQGYDITNVDCSSLITSGQTSAYALGTTTGDDYTINALGMEISIASPAIVPIKFVNSQLSIVSRIGDIVTYTVMMENLGTIDALDVVLQDTLEPGLYFVPGSLTLNGVPQPFANLSAGVPIGTIVQGDTSEVVFNVEIIAPPLSGVFNNRATSSFLYSACVADINTSNLSNLVLITLSGDAPGPTDFTGKVHKCKFVNKNMYSLVATWDPVPLPILVPYEIFKNGELVGTISATGPYIFKTCLDSRSDANNYYIVANYGNGITSDPIKYNVEYE